MIKSVLKLKPFIVSNNKVYSKKNNAKVNTIARNHNKIDKINYDFFDFVETVNGRCAMQGFMWGIKNGITSNNNIIEQVTIKNTEGNYYNGVNVEHILYAVLITGLITFGTTVSTLNYETDVVKFSLKNTPNKFTKENEKLNGRLAMLGFIILCFIKK